MAPNKNRPAAEPRQKRHAPPPGRPGALKQQGVTRFHDEPVAEFNGEEKDLLQSVAALKAAIVVISKHHGSALMQLPRSHVLGVAATIEHEMQKHAQLLEGFVTHSERQVVQAIIQSPEDYFDASPTFKQLYAPKSGEIFGISSR